MCSGSQRLCSNKMAEGCRRCWIGVASYILNMGQSLSCSGLFDL